MRRGPRALPGVGGAGSAHGGRRLRDDDVLSREPGDPHRLTAACRTVLHYRQVYPHQPCTMTTLVLFLAGWTVAAAGALIINYFLHANDLDDDDA